MDNLTIISVGKNFSWERPKILSAKCFIALGRTAVACLSNQQAVSHHVNSQLIDVFPPYKLAGSPVKQHSWKWPALLPPLFGGGPLGKSMSLIWNFRITRDIYHLARPVPMLIPGLQVLVKDTWAHGPPTRPNSTTMTSGLSVLIQLRKICPV